jgi:hypothetical protein
MNSKALIDLVKLSPTNIANLLPCLAILGIPSLNSGIQKMNNKFPVTSQIGGRVERKEKNEVKFTWSLTTDCCAFNLKSGSLSNFNFDSL